MQDNSVLPSSQTSTSKWMALVIVLAVILVAALIFIIYSLTQKKEPASQDVNNSPTSQPTLPPQENSNQDAYSMLEASWAKDCSSSDRINMSHSPMNLSDVGNILPLGFVAGAHVTPIDHLYFSPADFNSPRDKYPVYAMADGYIVEVSVRRVNVDSGAARAAEYRIIFQHSCQTISYFDLVTSLDESILNQIPELQTRDYVSNIRVPVQGGQLIGRIGGQTLDTAVYNFDLELSGFISPELYIAEPWKIHTDDFFRYFSEPLRSQLLAKNIRKVEPLSGKIDYDQPGKLIGNWFLEGSNGYAGVQGNTGVGNNGQGYWSGHLAIVYDAVDPNYIWVSIGNYAGVPTHFGVKGNAPDPATIDKDSGVIKYELVDPANYSNPTGTSPYGNQTKGVILLQVLENEKLKVEIFPNKTAGEVAEFTSTSQIYER